MDPIVDYRAKSTTASVAARYMSRVYGWMTFGLLITGVTSFVIASNPDLIKLVLGSVLGMILSFVVPFGLVMYLSAALNRMSVGAATFCFLLYSFTNAFLMSSIFLRYNITTIGSVFFITAGAFGGMALFGTITKKDLTAFGTFLGMALWGIIIALVVNMFVHSAGLDFGISCIGVLVFAGLTAYDVQRIKTMGASGDTESDAAHKFAIMGALILYLDFINLFLSLLRIFGDRRRD